MSGIYIPNVEKENSCFDCPIWSLCWDDKISEDIRKYKRCPAIPAADVQEVRHGHWIIKRDAMGTEYTICDACGLGLYNENGAGFERLDLRNCGYCPNCGAKMDERSEGEE